MANILMVYRYYKFCLDLEIVGAFFFTPEGLIEDRNAISKLDDTGYGYMSFQRSVLQQRYKKIIDYISK